MWARRSLRVLPLSLVGSLLENDKERLELLVKRQHSPLVLKIYRPENKKGRSRARLSQLPPVHISKSLTGNAKVKPRSPLASTLGSTQLDVHATNYFCGLNTDRV